MEPRRISEPALLSLVLTLAVVGCGAGTSEPMVPSTTREALEMRVLRFVEDRTDGVVGFYLERVDEPQVLASVNATTAFFPSSTIKVALHIYAVQQVSSGALALDDPVTVYPEFLDSCLDDHTGQVSEVRELGRVMRDNMTRPDNPATDALQELFGDGDAELGRTRVNAAVTSIVGTDTTVISHKLSCQVQENRTTLTDLVTLYREVMQGGVFDPNALRTFVDHMDTEPFVTQTVLEEAPSGVDGMAYIERVGAAQKAGVTSIFASTFLGFASIAGWISLPTRDGPRDYVFGLFVDATVVEGPIPEVYARELLRGEIRNALDAQ